MFKNKNNENTYSKNYNYVVVKFNNKHIIFANYT